MTFALCFVLCHKQLKQMILQEAQLDEMYMDHRVVGNHANEKKEEEPIKYQK